MLPGIKESNDSEVLEYPFRTKKKQKGFSASILYVELKNIATKIQAESAVLHIESYKKMKASFQNNSFCEFPSIESFYPRIFNSSPGNSPLKPFEKSFFSNSALNSQLPKNNHYKMSQKIGSFLPKINKTREITSVLNSLNQKSFLF